MTSKKKITGASVATIIVAIIGLFGANEGGLINLSFNETNIDSHDQNIFTSIINQFGLDITPEELKTLCGEEIIDELYRTICNIISRNIGE